MSVDLTSTYLGLTLRNPVVASPGPVTGDPDQWRALDDAGVGAIVLPSLFEEEIESDSWWISDLLDAGRDVVAEASDYLPEFEDYSIGPDRFLDLVTRAKQTVGVPVIASLNGTSPGGWVHYASRLVDAGADAIELNVYDVITDPSVAGAMVEDRVVDLVRTVRSQVPVPLAVKIGPWFSALANMATKLAAAGADGLVLFNRLYQPDIDLAGPSVQPKLTLSMPGNVRQSVAWIGILSGQVPLSLAASGGVDSSEDVVKLILAGADATMTTASLLRHGAGHVEHLVTGLAAWLEERGYQSVAQAKGSVSLSKAAEPDAYQRANYYQTLHSWGPVR
ncbi:MAG: dihydroorotate dehydrogenase-like protein [Candidatus Nanopelagicales bacterium]